MEYSYGRLLPKLVCELADPLASDSDGVARMLPDPVADRGAARDEVAGQQCHVVRNFTPQFLRREDPVGYRVVLPLLAIENGAHHELCRIDAGDDDRAERAVAVDALGARPLREGRIAAEDVVGGDVVDAGVAEGEVVGFVG